MLNCSHKKSQNYDDPDNNFTFISRSKWVIAIAINCHLLSTYYPPNISYMH